MIEQEKMKISIITVVYNGAKTLEQTISSVLNQSYPNIEYIIIDGGSTDGSLDIIKKYESKLSFWISEPDKGLYDAMNKGISFATGDIIGMINSDDWYEKNAVQIVVQAAGQNPEKLIFHGDRYDIQLDGSKKIRKFHPSSFKFKYYGMTYNHPSLFVRKQVYEDEKYNITLRSQSDYEFILKQFLKRPECFLYIPVAYVNYRLDGISANIKLKTALMEGYIARKNASLNVFQNIFSAIVRYLRVTIFRKI